MKQIHINAIFISSDPEKWRPNELVWGGVRDDDLCPSMDLSGGKPCRPNLLSPY